MYRAEADYGEIWVKVLEMARPWERDVRVYLRTRSDAASTQQLWETLDEEAKLDISRKVQIESEVVESLTDAERIGKLWYVRSPPPGRPGGGGLAAPQDPALIAAISAIVGAAT